MISRKKSVYPVGPALQDYMAAWQRLVPLPVGYSDLHRYDTAVALYDQSGHDTLWTTVSYGHADRQEVHSGLLTIYAILKAAGDRRGLDHLAVDRVDLCTYGNTQPFRVRIINGMNENFDYFYVKRADASRVYGLELEHILSPNRIAFLGDGETLIEEHIYGIPGDIFLDRYLDDNLNPVRLAKEFVKFNERCFIRLLGDMHAANFVVDITVDFEENMYRIRAIDFDQQSHEPRKQVYLPQFYRENNTFVRLAMDHLTQESVRQYQREEQALIQRRMRLDERRLKKLLATMAEDDLAPRDNIVALRTALATHYEDRRFLTCRSMGEMVHTSLARLSLD